MLFVIILEKDVNIVLFELLFIVGSDVEVRKFKVEKDKLVNEFKE